jgi:transposase
MTATTRSTECNAEATTLYVAFELGSTKWTLGLTHAPAQRPRVRMMAAGDLRALEQELLNAKARFGLPLDAPVQSCYEAGRDGFWLHRWWLAHGMANVVVDSSSIEVNRKARRAKTDRLDVRKLLALLMRWRAGERKAWSVVHVPSPAAENDRQLTREMDAVGEDRTRVRNRIQGLLATQGVRLALDRQFARALTSVVTGDGRPVPPALRERLLREWAHLQSIEARLALLETARDERIAHGTDRVAQVARQLVTLRSVGEASAAVFSAEMFGTRTFQNPRQVGALMGLVPVPYRSDQCVQDQGISKAGRGSLRGLAIQIAWCWRRWQPDSALTQWFERRFAMAGKRTRRIGIVALARKLMIALWRYVEHGVVPDGARLTPRIG